MPLKACKLKKPTLRRGSSHFCLVPEGTSSWTSAFHGVVEHVCVLQGFLHFSFWNLQKWQFPCNFWTSNPATSVLELLQFVCIATCFAGCLNLRLFFSHRNHDCQQHSQHGNESCGQLKQPRRRLTLVRLDSPPVATERAKSCQWTALNQSCLAASFACQEPSLRKLLRWLHPPDPLRPLRATLPGQRELSIAIYSH